MTVLLTGGAGYIGSHTCVELLDCGFDVIVADNFCNSKPEVVDRCEKITGKKIKLYEADVADKEAMTRVFSENKIDAVVHFASYKAVPESVKKPVMYYRNNLDTTLTLLEVMKEFGVGVFVFSSSATVYGDKNPVPFVETMPTSTTNPYGTTKLFIEKILTDAAAADENMSVVLLRYSTRSVLTKADLSAKTRTESRTTSCRTLRRLRQASVKCSTFTATTTTLPMAQAYVTISTLLTSQKVMLKRSNMRLTKKAARYSTSEQAQVTALWTSFMRLKKLTI